jgi:hypothetical protein
MLLIGSGVIAPATGSPQGKKTVIPKKTSRSPKSASPAQPPEQTKKAPTTTPRAPKAAAGRAPRKTVTATPEPTRRVVTRRKRPAVVAPSVPDAVQPPVVVSDEDVRIRAYFLSLEYRGNGNDVDFWLLAERELRRADRRID